MEKIFLYYCVLFPLFIKCIKGTEALLAWISQGIWTCSSHKLRESFREMHVGGNWEPFLDLAAKKICSFMVLMTMTSWPFPAGVTAKSHKRICCKMQTKWGLIRHRSHLWKRVLFFLLPPGSQPKAKHSNTTVCKAQQSKVISFKGGLCKAHTTQEI